MTAATTPTISAAARQKLARLAHPHSIVFFQAGDDAELCATCMVGIVPTRHGWVHSPDEIRALRTMAGDGWPR